MVRFSRTSFIGRVLYAATASVLSVVAVAIASGTGGSSAAPQAGLEVGSLSGALSPGHRPAGTVLQVSDLEPGQSTDGIVTVVNRGGSGGLLTLAAPEVSDAPGTGGGALSKRLQVTLLDVTGSGAPELVYSGGVAGMRARTLGYIRPGESRSYLVGASFIPGDGPESAAAGDNSYTGGSTRLTLEWGAMTASSPRLAPVTTDHLAPNVSIQVPGRQDVLKRGRLNVRVLCSEACGAQAALSVDGQTVTARSAERPPARSVGLSLDLSKDAQNSLREKLAAGETAVFEATATARDAAGNRATATRRVGLAPAP